MGRLGDMLSSSTPPTMPDEPRTFRSGAEALEFVRCREQRSRVERARFADFARDIGPRFQSYSWRTFPAGREPAADAAAEWLYADAWWADRCQPNLMLFGPVGTGKTGLAICLGHELLHHERAVRYVIAREWLDAIRQSYSGTSDTAEVENVARDAEVLILDDLGSERPTEFALEKLLSLVDHRYRNMLPTIVTSNHAPSRLVTEFGHVDALVGERLVSRLVEACVKVSFDGFSNLRVASRAAAAGESNAA